MVTYLWTPKARHCTRVTKDKDQYRTGMYHRNFKLEDGRKIRKTIRHFMPDYKHVLPKLHCPWDDIPKNEVDLSTINHGLMASDVTLRLRPPPPTHSAHPDVKDAPLEWHGRQAQDVTALHTYMCRGQRPPSRDYWFGREATDISDHLRIIPPIAPEGEAQEFHGRPKSDVTNFDLFPPLVPETESRTEAARPLGKCPPGQMADFAPLVRDKHGRLVRPQPRSPKSPKRSKSHAPRTPQKLKPGEGGILAHIVTGRSRSEAKRPLGRCPAGVMVDYVPFERDEKGRVIRRPSKKGFPMRPSSRRRISSPPVLDPAAQRALKYARDILHPLGKGPEDVMSDYHHVERPLHRHTTDGLWSPPTTIPVDPPLESGQMSPTRAAGRMSPGPMSPREAQRNSKATVHAAKRKLGQTRRWPRICPVHGLSTRKPAKNIRWPKDEVENLKSKGKQRRSTTHLSRSANASPTCFGSARECDPIKHDPRMARPRSVCGAKSPDSGRRCICPGDKPGMEYSHWTAAKEKEPYPGSKDSQLGSARSCASSGSRGSKAPPGANVKRARKNKVISPVMTPEHYQHQWFGHYKTYVTDPAISPNLTPPTRRSMRLPGQATAVSTSRPKCGLVKNPMQTHIFQTVRHLGLVAQRVT